MTDVMEGDGAPGLFEFVAAQFALRERLGHLGQFGVGKRRDCLRNGIP